MPPQITRLDTTVFDKTVRPLLQRLPEDKIPQALNKKMFFVSLRAIQETERTNPFKILFELRRPVTLKREDGSTDEAPIGYALAAMRASKQWGARRGALSQRKRRVNLTREWQKFVTKKFDAMAGARKASTSFIRAGWAGVVAALSPFVRSKDGKSYQRSELKPRGAMKGSAKPARPGWSPVVSVENTAQAKTDKKLGLVKHGSPGLQKAFDKEMADWIPYLEKEVLKEEVEKFNIAQH